MLDCFCGSGTTVAVAEQLNRRWITCDLGRFAVHTARKRLLSLGDIQPFIVQNLGKYERQAWQVHEFGSAEHAASIVQNYRHFILNLYGAEPLSANSWIHGLKNRHYVHVGPVDSPVSANDVAHIAQETKNMSPHNVDTTVTVDILGWDFAFELNEVARQQANESNVSIRFIRIPREVLEINAVSQGDIKFYELAALSTTISQTKRIISIHLTDFIIPPDDVPADIQSAIRHWAHWIDYWAVDWDHKDDTFHNMWQSYRTPENSNLFLEARHKYASSGKYTIMIKVIDILGNDTTTRVAVEIN